MSVRSHSQPLDQTVASLSHDLREPLHSILGFARLMVDSKTGPLTDLQLRGVHATLNAGHRLQIIMDNLIDLATFESGSFNLTMRPTELIDALGDSGSTFKWSSVAVSAQVPLTLPLVTISPVHIRRLVYNLAVVISECSQESAVWIVAEAIQSPMVRVSVSGVGSLGALDIDRLSASARLGLAVSTILVAQHQSTLQTLAGPKFTFELSQLKETKAGRSRKKND